MIPRQPVRAGDVVHTGQIIGRMGSTGKSTGTHLHFELLRNGSDVNPVEYLPTGVVRIDKSTTREGRAAQASGKSKATAKSKAKPKPKPKVKLPKFNRATKFPDEKPTIVCQPGGGDKGSAAVDACVAALSTTRGDRHAPPVSRADPATEGETTTEPGVPLPYRGASPDPS